MSAENVEKTYQLKRLLRDVSLVSITLKLRTRNKLIIATISITKEVQATQQMISNVMIIKLFFRMLVRALKSKIKNKQNRKNVPSVWVRIS